MTLDDRFQPVPADKLDPDSTDWPAVYDHLRKLAASYMARGQELHTLQPTALVNEAWLKLGDAPEVRGREHFLALAATAMRHILVDRARDRRRDKRGGGNARVTLDRVAENAVAQEFDVLAVEDALGKLAAVSERQARIVEMRAFGGMTVEEVARVLGVSERTVKGDWQIARAWLKRQLRLAQDGAQDADTAELDRD